MLIKGPSGCGKSTLLHAICGLIPGVSVSSMQNAKELVMSLEMRAFRAERNRTSFFELSLRPSDIVMLCGILAFTILIALILIFI